MILLLAASNHEAESFAERYNIPKWHYIYSMSSLKGMGRPVVCRVGMYWQRSDIIAIERKLDSQQAVFISPVDIVKKTN